MSGGLAMEAFSDCKILVVGGAGFVGSNLVKRLLACSPREVVIVDNLLSAEKVNIPDNPAVKFVEGSITSDLILNELQDDFDYIFHLSTYHGNQSSIHDPLADHENNTLTTLKLYERIKDFRKLKKVVYSSAGCTVAKKTYEDAMATTEDARYLCITTVLIRYQKLLVSFIQTIILNAISCR
jgi:nucleoside-diphosphate-sugar epimerase